MDVQVSRPVQQPSPVSDWKEKQPQVCLPSLNGLPCRRRGHSIVTNSFELLVVFGG